MIEGFRKVEGPMDTPNGYPLPLTYRPLTKHPVVVKQEGVELKQYPDVCIPAEEEIGPDEIRLICCNARLQSAQYAHQRDGGPSRERRRRHSRLAETG